MVFQNGVPGGRFSNADDIREANANHRGLMSKAFWALVSQLSTRSAWAGLSYAANWSDFGAGEAPGQYRKTIDGQIQLSGLAKKSIPVAPPGDAIATLPAGFRPAKIKRFSVVSATGYTQIAIATTGVVSVGAGGDAAATALDGILFDPAT